MPELPEVESFRKYIEETSLDQEIVKVEINDQKVVKDPPHLFVKTLTGAKITGTERIGKYLFLHLDKGSELMMHFGMTGSPVYHKGPETAPRHSRVDFRFGNGFTLAYNCPRKFGRLILADSVESYTKANKIGPDASVITQEDFISRISGRRTPIKAALMNQSILAGLGNWMVDEILYQASMHPEEPVQDLGKKEFELIFDKIQYIIEVALKNEAHIADFPEDFMIHSRWTDKGRPDAPSLDLEVIKVGGRSTYFDPKRQVRR